MIFGETISRLSAININIFSNFVYTYIYIYIFTYESVKNNLKFPTRIQRNIERNKLNAVFSVGRAWPDVKHRVIERFLRADL